MNALMLNFFCLYSSLNAPVCCFGPNVKLLLGSESVHLSGSSLIIWFMYDYLWHTIRAFWWKASVCVSVCVLLQSLWPLWNPADKDSALHTHTLTHSQCDRRRPEELKMVARLPCQGKQVLSHEGYWLFLRDCCCLMFLSRFFVVSCSRMRVLCNILLNSDCWTKMHSVLWVCNQCICDVLAACSSSSSAACRFWDFPCSFTVTTLIWSSVWPEKAKSRLMQLLSTQRWLMVQAHRWPTFHEDPV